MIETERLVLRKLTLDDAWDMYEVLTDEGVPHWFGMKPLGSVEETRDFLSGGLRCLGCDLYAITEKGRDKVIGLLQVAYIDYYICLGGGCRSIKTDKCALGYCLSAKYRGRGYMTEAVKAVVSTLYETMPMLETIMIDIFVGNEASTAVARKSGFYYDNSTNDVLSAYGNVEDEDHYSLTRADYEWAHRQCA